MNEKWSALRANPSRFEFMGNKNPKCPHCGDEIDIQRHELWQLYDDADQDIECPHCDHEFHVQVHVSYSYSTDDQQGQDDDEDDAPVVRECCNAECGWSGVTDRMLGAVGPLCPECGEVTESA